MLIVGLRNIEIVFAFCEISMSDGYTTTFEEEDASDYVVEPRVHTMCPLRRESTGRVAHASRESIVSPSTLRPSTLRPSNLGPSTSRERTTGRRERDPEDEPSWLGPLEFDGEDLHHDLGHHVVSDFWASVASSDTAFGPYGGSVFAACLDALDLWKLEVVQACPIYQTVLIIREVVCPNASRRFLGSILVWWWDTPNTLQFPWGDMTITPEDYNSLIGISFTGTSIFLFRRPSCLRIRWLWIA